MMNIGIDMMGGDYAPLEAVKGLARFLSTQHSDVLIHCIGNEVELAPLIQEHGIDTGKIKLVHAADTIGYHEHPTKALKEKTQSSIAIGFQLLATGAIDAFISAGNTGAMMVGVFYSIKAIEGVLRPTISTVIPKVQGGYGLILDVGLQADCKPENLLQNAILGSIYAQNILEIEQPSVGLINIGEEEGKGNLLAQATYPLLKENQQINFVGNIEGRDILINKADVMICDGFTGNVVLKLAESVHDIVKRRNIQDEHFERFNFESYGGVPVLGVSKPVIIGHGISSSTAFVNMIRIASRMISTSFTEKIQSSFIAG